MLHLLGRNFGFITGFDLLNKNLSRFETGNEVFVNDHRGVLRDVPRYLLSSLLIDEAAEPSHVDVLSFGQRVFHHREKRFQSIGYLCFVNPSLIGDLCNYVCFRHDFLNFNVYCVVENSGVKNGSTKVGVFGKL